jgi:hypothetical protein
MATFVASTKPVSRSSGRSAVAAAAYRSAERLTNDRDGMTHDYRARDGVEATFILAPDGQSADRSQLWNAAEAAEKRSDARTAREWILALPHELTGVEREHLVGGFAAELVDRYGVAVDVAIHSPGREGDDRNHHAHLLMTTREVARLESGALAFGPKAALELSDGDRAKRGLGRGSDEITTLREAWSQRVNASLERAGVDERVSHLSRKAQGLDGPGEVKLGPAASAMERRGERTEAGDRNRAIMAGREALADAREERRGERRQVMDNRAQARTAQGSARETALATVAQDRERQLEDVAHKATARTERREYLVHQAQDPKARSVGERLVEEARGLLGRVEAQIGRAREWVAERYADVRERAGNWLAPKKPSDAREQAAEAYRVMKAHGAAEQAPDAAQVRQQAAEAYRAMKSGQAQTPARDGPAPERRRTGPDIELE